MAVQIQSFLEMLRNYRANSFRGCPLPLGPGHLSKMLMSRSQHWASQGNSWSRCIQFVYLGSNVAQNSLGMKKNRELAFKGQLLQRRRYCQKPKITGPKFQLNSHHYKILHCSVVFTCNNCISLFLLTIQQLQSLIYDHLTARLLIFVVQLA